MNGENEKITRIKALLDELAPFIGQGPSSAGEPITGLELPSILSDIVDFLAPELRPYEYAFYMFLVRNSVVRHGTQLVRVSRRSLQSGVIRSSSGQKKGNSSDAEDSAPSYMTVQSAFSRLEEIGAIRQEGDTNREGTLYRVMLPEEIPAAKARMLACSSVPLREISETDVDYYNVKENRRKVFERDSFTCQYCGKKLTLFSATLDHVKPVREGGRNNLENLVTCCLECNSKKNVRLVSDFLAKKNRF